MAPPEAELDADRIDDGAMAEGAARRPVVPIWTRIRVLTLATLGPLVTGYAAIAALLALITAIATKAHFSTVGVLTAATPSWLAAHQVPVSIFGLELGVLPLLPTIGLMAITARAAGGAAERLELDRPGQAGQVIGTIAGAHGVFGVVMALLCADQEVRADPLAGFYYPTLVAAVAATVGVAKRCGLLDAVAERADAVAVAGLRTGALAVTLLLTAGAAVLTFGLLTSVSTARDLFPLGIGNALGMLLLSIGYLPNAIVAATSFVAGPGFSMGAVAMGPLEFTGGPVPGLPLLAALPEEQAGWWPVLFVLPLGVGVLVGRRLRDVAEEPMSRLRGVAVAAGVVALSFVVLAGSAGGRAGSGPFDPVSMRAVAVSLALVLWIAIPAAVTAWFGGPRPTRDHLPGLIDDDGDGDLAEEEEEPDSDAEPAEDPPADRENETNEPSDAPTDAPTGPDSTNGPDSTTGPDSTRRPNSTNGSGTTPIPRVASGPATPGPDAAPNPAAASPAPNAVSGSDAAPGRSAAPAPRASAPPAPNAASDSDAAPGTAPAPRAPAPQPPKAVSSPDTDSGPSARPDTTPAPRSPDAASGPPESTLATNTDNSADPAR